jgi:3D (Asp-Asp-Asp) domain-containing protein
VKINMNVSRTLFFRFLVIATAGLLIFCAPPPENPPPADQQNFGLSGEAGPDDFYCPAGYTYEKVYHLCEGRTGVLGPFSDAMVEKCRSFGGGAPCDGLHWQREFAHGIRGTGKCPNGTQWDAELEVCFSGNNVYGPFLKSQHERCVAAQGGPACETMRWSREFFESFRASKSPNSSADTLEFRLGEPADREILDVFSLWATYYRIPTVQHRGSSGIPLLDMNGNDLGVTLSRRDWCDAALEGSVRVVNSNGFDAVYNYAGSRQSFKQADCSDYVSLPGLAYSRFYRTKSSFGDGVMGYQLIPYRTIAVDPSYIPYGSVIYVPEARGAQIILPNGTQALHDGYFYAADTGGALHGKHIDVFIGSATENPFEFVRSNSSSLFKVYLIGAGPIKDRLKAAHQRR